MLFTVPAMGDKGAPTMTSDSIVHRYAAYYSGWCVAFGEHEIRYDEGKRINWLYGDSRIGLILSPGLKKRLFRVLLHGTGDAPPVELLHDRVKIGGFVYPIEEEEDRQGFRGIERLYRQSSQLHLFLTSHFCYPKGTRIVTFASQRPLGIIYKEIQPLELRLGARPS